LVTVKKTEHGKKHKEFCLVSVKKTQQIKQHHKIYVIIITTDLNKEDENIRQIIERHLRKKSYLK
jgi:5S rRNA maturation endonuclease (ribonuclease M5)